MQSPNFSQDSSSSLTPDISNFIYCFNCIGYFHPETFLTHISDCLINETSEQPPESFYTLITKLSLGQYCGEIISIYNNEVLKKITVSRKFTNTSTEDNSLSICENDNNNNNILEQLIKIQEDSKIKEYLDFTSNVKRVTKVKNVLRLITNNEMTNTKSYF